MTPTAPSDGAPAAAHVVRATGVAPAREEVEEVLRSQGLAPHAWANGPAAVYERHAHLHHKVLFCVQGGIVFHLDAGDAALHPGDRLELPAGVGHAATVGPDGVACVEAYR